MSEYPHVRVQDRVTRETRSISKRSYALNKGKYNLLSAGQQTEEEKHAAVYSENEQLKRKLAELESKINGPIPSMVDSTAVSPELSVSRETAEEVTETAEDAGAIDNEVKRRGPGRPAKNAQ